MKELEEPLVWLGGGVFSSPSSCFSEDEVGKCNMQTLSQREKYGKRAYKMKCNSTLERKRDIEATGMPARQPCN